ncbi:Plasma kallikrein [Pseudolycoriella hygida]|uniref:Plasma kallikrein n=1 Tax=Pseudolycoriella hygida TaxID=35572 RepID=A0A9Q0MME5_9DIPT|nr:Plasma kallikrein [Pseudolycoriella hygida]
MLVKLIFLFVLLGISASVADDVIGVPKKFTRSRYSQRKSTTTTTELPESSYDNNVDMVTEVFSEELLPNKVEESSTNNPFDLNETSTLATSTPINESLNVSTISDLIETTTEQEIEVSTEKQIESNGVFPCGESTYENHPWIAVLVHSGPGAKTRKRTLSKGVLIDERHVLTTVSSLHNSRPYWIVSGVRLGDTRVTVDGPSEESKSTFIGIEHIFQHKNRDIALIKLSENVNFTKFIRPICLPDNDHYDYNELFLHMCKKNMRRNAVSTINATPLTPQDCEIMFRRKNATITPEEFCAWDENGDSCTGDLGGPLTTIDNGRYSVIGLNSHINTKVKFNYGDYPGIYVRVGSHLPWIRKVLKFNRTID